MRAQWSRLWLNYLSLCQGSAILLTNKARINLMDLIMLFLEIFLEYIHAFKVAEHSFQEPMPNSR